MESPHPQSVGGGLPAGATYLQEALALPVRQVDSGRLEVDLPEEVATLTAVPRRYRPGPHGGDILLLEVEQVTATIAELRRRGATVLIESVLTEWGTESAFIAGPSDSLIEVRRPLEPAYHS